MVVMVPAPMSTMPNLAMQSQVAMQQQMMAMQAQAMMQQQMMAMQAQLMQQDSPNSRNEPFRTIHVVNSEKLERS
jgi:hypothetical protein